MITNSSSSLTAPWPLKYQRLDDRLCVLYFLLEEFPASLKTQDVWLLSKT